MTEPRAEPSCVVVTGAHSPLGRMAVARLLAETTCDVIAVVTPWFDGVVPGEETGRIHVERQDLSLPVSAALSTWLEKAAWVFHFAWFRHPNAAEAIRQNLDAIDRLLEPMADAARFVLISSVGASDGAISTYGRAKWRAAEVVRQHGGCVLVCGLVVATPPFGPHAMLGKWARGLPVRPRFLLPRVPVYPTPIGDVGAAVVGVENRGLSPGTYRLYDVPPVNLNDMLSGLEADGARFRPALPVPTAGVLSAVRFLRFLRLLPRGLADKLLTFLYKDRQYLDALPPVRNGD